MKRQKKAAVLVIFGLFLICLFSFNSIANGVTAKPFAQLAQTAEVTPLPGAETTNRTTQTSGSLTTQFIERQITPIRISVSVKQGALDPTAQSQIEALQNQVTALQASLTQTALSLFQNIAYSQPPPPSKLGITDADIPDDITAGNYLALTGGTLSGALTVNGNLGVGTDTPTIGFAVASGGIFQGGLAVEATTTVSSLIATSTLEVRGTSGNDLVVFGGLVGVATATPWGLLSVEHIDSNDFNFPAFVVSDSGTATPSLVILNRNGNVGLGTSSPIERLTLTGGNFLNPVWASPTLRSATDLDGTSSGANGIYVAGRYAYVVKDNNSDTCSGTTDLQGCELQIYDVTSASTTFVGGIAIGASDDVYSVQVFGRYAYVTKSANGGACSGTTVTGCEFSIYDISNPSSIAAVSGLDISDDNVQSAQISGRYAYLAKSSGNGLCSTAALDACGVVIVDISNPSVPAVAGAMALGGRSGSDAYPAGRYLYVLSNGDADKNEFTIWDISNVASTTEVGGVDLGTLSGAEVEVVGRFAYLMKDANSGTCSGTTLTGCEFSIYDISNPASPAAISGINLASGSNSASSPELMIAGRYAYISQILDTGACNLTILPTGCEFVIIDIDKPASPIVAGGVDTGDITVRAAFVSGRYAYVLKNVSTAACSVSGATGCEFVVYDLGGADIGAASIGSLEAGSLQVREDLIVSGSTRVSNSLNVGLGGVQTDGTLAVASSSALMGRVGIGSTSPQAMLGIDNSSFANKSPALLIKAGGTGDGNVAIAVDAADDCIDTTASSTNGMSGPCILNDLAELYPVSEAVEGGDIVTFDPNAPIYVKKAVYEDRGRLAGAISTSPAMVFEGSRVLTMGGAYAPKGGKAPLVLSGRVPVRVVLENGPIRIGDPITISRTPGIGTKATESGQIIGYALGSLEIATTAPGVYDRIMVFASLSYWKNPNEASPNVITNVIETVSEWLKGAVATIKEVFVGKLTVGAPGQPAGITIYDQANGQPYCFGMRNGAPEYLPGVCGTPPAPAPAQQQPSSDPSPAPESPPASDPTPAPENPPPPADAPAEPSTEAPPEAPAELPPSPPSQPPAETPSAESASSPSSAGALAPDASASND